MMSNAMAQAVTRARNHGLPVSTEPADPQARETMRQVEALYRLESRVIMETFGGPASPQYQQFCKDLRERFSAPVTSDCGDSQ